MGMSKKYWTGLDELHQTEAFEQAVSNEFQETQRTDEFLGDERLKESNTGRRDFLRFMGFSLTAATLAACETPVVKSIPYVVKPNEITPGVANWYASTFYDGSDYGNVLVKTREGRPIFIKGNAKHGLEKGALNSRINASVISLYDSARLRGPQIAGAASDWAAVDAAVKKACTDARAIRILSHTVISPATRRAIAEFSNRYAGKVKHIQYDTVSYQGIASAHEISHGVRAVPRYDFSKARVIVSIACDFLGTWVTPNHFAAQYGSLRNPANGWMAQHFQFESNMSLTGSNADLRVHTRPSDEGKVAAALYAALSGGSAAVEGVDEAGLNAAVSALKANRGAALVVSGSNDANVQRIVNAINEANGAYGNLIDIKNPLNLFRGNDAEVEALIAEMEGGAVDTLIVYGCNPAYSWVRPEAFRSALAKVNTSVAFSLVADETASRCTIQAPDHHYLESWNDLSPFEGRVDLVQPTITPLYNTRQAPESLLAWSDNPATWYDYLRTGYNAGYSPLLMHTDNTWNVSVHNGTLSEPAGTSDATAVVLTPPAAPTDTAAPAVAQAEPLAAPAPAPNLSDAIAAVKAVQGGEWELSLYQKVTMGAGQHATNPYLQETPDPMTKVTWDNYITMAPADVEKLKLSNYIGQCDCANVAKVTVNGVTLSLPVFPAPGQKPGTIGIALGYGRGDGGEAIGNAAYQTGRKGDHLTEGEGKKMTVGRNAYPLAALAGGVVNYHAYSVTVEATTEEYALAATQIHNTIMGRTSVVRETDIATYLGEKDKARGTASYNLMATLSVHEDVNGDNAINAKDRKPVRDFDLWSEHPIENVGHRWGMTIDLSSCIGCGACITACHTENNVPVVGKDEVLRHRDMHWMRIDRYYSSDFATVEETSENKKLGTIAAYRDMEHPELNPQTVHMPMFCQHCNHAPCETVCPVAATVHSNEGLNNMAYNRCIGTRYCANNCPYKVRRFNWFNYVTNDKFSMFNPSQDDVMRMVLNPDVTVRTRGVMEKCSMCQQRIQGAKVSAKNAGKPVGDDPKLTACAEACPTHAITFGDLNDTESLVRRYSADVRAYYALEEVGAQPNVSYLTKVRNATETSA